MLRSPHRKQPSAWFTLGILNIKSPNKISSNHRFFSKTFAYFNYFYYFCTGFLTFESNIYVCNVTLESIKRLIIHPYKVNIWSN